VRRARALEISIHWTVAGRRLLSPTDCRKLAAGALAHGGRAEGRLSLVFVGDEELARMHAAHLGDPRPTDVMSFDLGGEGGPVEGELYVSVERAALVARRRALVPRRELALYVVHGCLHLVGFDDRTPAQRRRMRAAERAVLAPLRLAHPCRARAKGLRSRMTS
jgi:probable rRNA maturation factor